MVELAFSYRPQSSFPMRSKKDKCSRRGLNPRPSRSSHDRDFGITIVENGYKHEALTSAPLEHLLNQIVLGMVWAWPMNCEKCKIPQ